MKHFKLHILFLLLLCVSYSYFAQSPKIDKARIQFISEKLNLEPAVAQKFWPVYNEYVDKLKSIRHERRKLFKEYNYSNNPAEAEQFLKKYSQLETAEEQLKLEYIQKFKQIIGTVKTAHLIRAEEEFKLELVKILKSDKPD
jgi:Spy/CpxP family protein refolding chaperone